MNLYALGMEQLEYIFNIIFFHFILAIGPTLGIFYMYYIFVSNYWICTWNRTFGIFPTLGM